MEEKLSDTMVKIQQAALEEFSDKGFFGASLRQIVKNAGVTTGAFYGYFSSKGSVRIHCGTACHRSHGPIYGSTDRLCRVARGGAAQTYG